MADVEHHAEVLAQRRRGIARGEPGLGRQRLDGGVGIEMIGEVVDRFVGGLEEAMGLGLERQRHRPAGAPLQLDQMRDDSGDLRGIGIDDVRPGDPGLEPQRRALDRRVDALAADLGQDVGHVHRVLGALVGAPVGLVDLLLDQRVLERAIGKGVDGVEVHVVVVEERLERPTRLRIVDQPFRRCRGQAERYAESVVRRHALFHRGDVARQAVPDLLPGVARVNQRRIGQVAEPAP